MKNRYLIFLSLIIFSFIIPKKDNPKTILLDDLSSQLEQKILIEKDQCLAFTVIKNDSIIYFKGFGHKDKKHKLLPDSSTIFRIGSITKSFTAVLMLQLIEEGYFKLDDPIEKYVPEIKNLHGYTDSTKITFRQLASHTSGLEREPSRKDLSYGSTSEWESQLLLAIPETKFALKPNKAMLYSNIGYGILGLAISRAANSSFIKLITDRIFIPLNMQNSYFDVPKDKINDLALGIDTHGNMDMPKEEHAGRGWRVPNGGIYSTSADLSKFITMLMGLSKQKLLSTKSLSLMRKIISKDIGSNGGYALGTMVYNEGNDAIFFGHNGSTSGYMSCFAFDSLRKTGVIMLINFNSNKNLWKYSIDILKKLR